MRNRELRRAPGRIEIREDSGTCTLEGYASTFNSPYDMGWYTETVAPGAFRRTLGQKPDVRLLVNHGGLPIARTSSGNLTLTEDEIGLRVSASLDATDPDVQALIPKMRRGDLDQMSFAFTIVDQEWTNEMEDREIKAVDLTDGDVSVVTYPANPGATCTLRSDGPDSEAITAAIRSATPEQLPGVLRRALQHLAGAGEDTAEALRATEAASQLTQVEIARLRLQLL